ncbi:MAG: DUF4123 domain-containing protein [Bryobacteraceae bacterium]
MRATLEIRGGPHSGRSLEIRPGEPCRVGRGTAASYIIPQDEYLSSLHFELNWDGRTCRLKDLNSANGTFLNGARVTDALLADGQEIRAGQSRFRVCLVPDSSPRSSAKDLIRSLEQSQPLYAVLDAARSTRILELLSGTTEQFQCLYDGESAVKLAACAPYLVRLSVKSRLLRKLVREGSGKSWGVYVVCECSFAELRKHLRHFLMVKSEGGEDFYFRFYDPRVLRVFLPTCTEEQSSKFIGPVTSFFVEEDEGGVLREFAAKRPLAPVAVTKPL